MRDDLLRTRRDTPLGLEDEESTDRDSREAVEKEKRLLAYGLRVHDLQRRICAESGVDSTFNQNRELQFFTLDV